MNWKKVKLGEICEFLSGFAWSAKNFKESGKMPIIRIQNMCSDKPDDFIYWDEKYDEKFIIKKNDLLLSLSGSIKIDYWKGVDALLNQRIVKITSNSSVSDRWFFWQMQSGLKKIEKMGKWALVNNVSITDLKNLEIPLPDLATQKHIAEVLDKADALRQQNRQLLAQYDKLLQSTFIELFGDPVKNPKGWEVKKLGEVAKAERGRFSPRPRNDPSYFDGIYPFIQTGDISSSNHRLTKWQQTLNEKGTKVSKRFDKGTIVVAIVGATIGASAILEIGTYAPDSVIGITVNNKFLNNYFLEYVLRYWKPIFLAQAPATARANINLETFKPLPIPVPPLPLQQHFAKIVEQIEAQKAQAQTALAESEALFEGLLAGYFNG